MGICATICMARFTANVPLITDATPTITNSKKKV